jgi:uncharacterized membrane protein HdeD (DUF308 family)
MHASQRVVDGRSVELPERLPRGSWLFFLIPAILWLIFAFVVLSFSHRSVTAIAVLAGALFIALGAFDLFTALVDESWWLWHVIIGTIALGAGITCFVYPNETFHVMAELFAWYLFCKGTFDIVRSLAFRHLMDLWGLALLGGAFELAIGLWALSYSGHSKTLLTLWVALIAIGRSITCFVLAFAMRETVRAINPT